MLEATVPPANPPVNLIRGARIRFAPGQPAGSHRHPASVVGVVTEGSFNFQRRGEPARLLKPSDSFFEPAGQMILHFDNASNTQAAEIVAFYLTDARTRPFIELLEEVPGN